MLSRHTGTTSPGGAAPGQARRRTAPSRASASLGSGRRGLLPEDRLHQGAALTSLGSARRQVRRVEDAITAHQDAVAIYRETGDRHSEGIALNNLGLALREVRRVEEASVTPSDKWRFPDLLGVPRDHVDGSL